MTKISAEYLDLNRQLHANTPGWGTSARLRVPAVQQLVANVQPQTMLDYGCGKGNMAKLSGLAMDEYDPAIPGKEKIALDHYDMVVCTDVMEHVEPEFVDSVFAEISSLATCAVYFIIYLVPAVHSLPDGSNCHRTVQPADWWMKKIHAHFDGKVTHAYTRTELEVIILL